MEFCWKVFPGVDAGADRCARYTEIPESIDGAAGREALFSECLCTLPEVSEEGACALFMCRFTAGKEAFHAFGFGGCWFYRVYLNGALLLDNGEWGNKPYGLPPKPENFTVPAPCRKGENLLVVSVRSVPKEPVRLAFRELDLPHAGACAPTLENFDALPGKFPPEGTPERKRLQLLIQNGVRNVRSPEFTAFASSPALEEDEVRRVEERFPVLLYWEKALDHVLEQVRRTVPREDEVIFWHLYNMGYVIKTPRVCFGLDLSHRRAAELEEILDFVLVTHNHADHCDPGLFSRMSGAGKPVVSNFHPAPGFQRPPQELDVCGVKISTRENDHNDTLRKFVCSYCIGLPGCTVFASGDSKRVEQLDPAGPVDVFIPHPRVGLSVPAAAEKIKPRCVLYSHFLEMRHCPPSPWYAVPYDLLETEMEGLRRAGIAALAPLWGEKLVWNTALRRFVPEA